MFTIPASNGGILQTARPSAVTGTITNGGNAYDLPGGLADDYPYSTSADRALINGSLVAGAADYASTEFNTFDTRAKASFTDCNLSIVYSSSLGFTLLTDRITFVTPSLDIQYQVDGSTWVTINQDFAPGVLNRVSSLLVPTSVFSVCNLAGDIGYSIVTKNVLTVKIPSSSFTSDLNNLKVRFYAGTMTNTTNNAHKSTVSYNVWDIRADIT